MPIPTSRLLAGACTALFAVGPPSAAGATDTLLIHGHIFTGDSKAPWAQALAIGGTRIVAVGSNARILERRSAHTRLIDLHGKTVIPGVVDSHMHMLYGAFALHGLNLSTPAASITPDKPEVLIARLHAYATEHPRDTVLFGRADFSTVPPTTPSHALLDRAVPDRPVVIHNTSEHALWLNAAALHMAGLTDRPVADAARIADHPAMRAATRPVCCSRRQCSWRPARSRREFPPRSSLRCWRQPRPT